jgi:Isoprenylcysteine carboxyl methyltransferase (ICMT) family
VIPAIHRSSFVAKNPKVQAHTIPVVPVIPQSCTSQAINWVGVAALLAALSAMNAWNGMAQEWMALLALLAYALPIMVLEVFYLRTPWRASTGLDYSRRQAIDWPRVLVKQLGLYGTVGLIALIYWCFPEYKGGFYQRYWQFLGLIAAPVALASLAYFAWVDRWMLAPRDGFWQVGMAILGRFDQVDKAILVQHGLGWLVKLFFLPLMFIYTADFLKSFVEFDFSRWLDFRPDNEAFGYAVTLLYGIDVVVVTVGYFCTLRILDSHCRSTEPTASGWLWAIICYEPIWSFVYGAYLAYNTDAYEWWQWLQGSPVMSALWGGAIGLLTLIYVWASVGFGLRFSNLTNRGILTNGAYRFCKHPAYVSKNISWWLISIPFIAHPGATWTTMVQGTLLLLGLNGVYYLRARTEERHLSSDPRYVEYALAMNEHSIFVTVAKVLPFLRYRPGPKLVDIK